MTRRMCSCVPEARSCLRFADPIYCTELLSFYRRQRLPAERRGRAVARGYVCLPSA
jgi:hypothetical protein